MLSVYQAQNACTSGTLKTHAILRFAQSRIVFCRQRQANPRHFANPGLSTGLLTSRLAGDGLLSPIYLGLDIGSTTVKVAGVSADAVMVGQPVYLRLDQFKSQIEAVKQALNQYLASVTGRVAGVGVTGSGRELHRELVGADLSHTEIFAHAVGLMYLVHSGAVCAGEGADKRPIDQVGALIEIGGQDSKVIVFDDEGMPTYFNMNTICSAGTGEFLKQLADEAHTPLQQLGSVALQSRTPAAIDATCTVFSKRDFRHLTQKGVPLADRLLGACQAMVRNYLNNVAGNVTLQPPVFFQGGVAANAAVRQAFAQRLGTPVYITPHNGVVGALGMAVAVQEALTGHGTSSTRFRPDFFEREFDSRIRYCHGCANGCDLAQPYEVRGGELIVVETLGGRCDGCRNPRNIGETPAASVEMSIPVVRTHRRSQPLDVVHAGRKPVRSSHGRLFAGLDGGSRGTKYALLRSVTPRTADALNIEILAAGVTDTAGDAVSAVLRALARLEHAMPDGEELAGIGTTGSAGELFRDIVTTKATDTADYRSTEIIAHYAWASFWRPDVGTVMDIGGNDAKIIAVRDGGLDFAMNDKCAAGTGSFLEAVARRFGVSIEDYADIAAQAQRPARIAGRCAVFGESDIVHKSRLGFSTGDLFQGLAFAVCRTYLSDVGRGKPLRVPIVAQGGSFLNAAVQHAFRQTLSLGPDELLISSDPRHVLCAGALGAALLARGRWEQGYDSHFKGFAEVLSRQYSTVTATCRQKGCHRSCEGVIALLENGKAIAGYKAVDCIWGHFSGMADTQEKEHIERMLKPAVGSA